MRTEVFPLSLLHTLKQYITDTRLPITTAAPIFLSHQLLYAEAMPETKTMCCDHQI